ncbi:hypothetical protein NIES2098_48820 [Calothrix sp. NIES-2098]|nr:hypothetical protein NIES2098_48820 [Calothrix sp. NIES-2098]
MEPVGRGWGVWDETSAAGGFPTPLASSRETRPTQWLLRRRLALSVGQSPSRRVGVLAEYPKGGQGGDEEKKNK